MGKPPKSKPKQISFYCTAEFAERIQSEKVRRGMSTQDMVTAALSEYFSHAPVEELRLAEQKFAKKLAKQGKAPAHEWPHYDFQRRMGLAGRYFQQLPEPNRKLLEEFMVSDLKLLDSSRRKV